MPESQNQEILAYVPALNRAYLDFFESANEASINVLGEDILEPFGYLSKDINALAPAQAYELLQNYYKTRIVRLIGRAVLSELINDETNEIILPNDDVSRQILSDIPTVKANIILRPLFLRWNRDNTTEVESLEYVATVGSKELGSEVIERLKTEAQMAGNMWRRVGAVIFDDEKLIDGEHNESKPTAYTQTIEGDPRNSLSRGEGIEFSNDHHAEARLIARAARRGSALKEKKMAVTTFPCPVCAKDIAEAGLSSLYFVEGYAALDGRRVLEAAGVKLFRIADFGHGSVDGSDWRDYSSR